MRGILKTEDFISQRKRKKEKKRRGDSENRMPYFTLHFKIQIFIKEGVPNESSLKEKPNLIKYIG